MNVNLKFEQMCVYILILFNSLNNIGHWLLTAKLNTHTHTHTHTNQPVINIYTAIVNKEMTKLFFFSYAKSLLELCKFKLFLLIHKNKND